VISYSMQAFRFFELLTLGYWGPVGMVGIYFFTALAGAHNAIFNKRYNPTPNPSRNEDQPGSPDADRSIVIENYVSEVRDRFGKESLSLRNSDQNYRGNKGLPEAFVDFPRLPTFLAFLRIIKDIGFSTNNRLSHQEHVDASTHSHYKQLILKRIERFELDASDLIKSDHMKAGEGDSIKKQKYNAAANILKNIFYKGELFIGSDSPIFVENIRMKFKKLNKEVLATGLFTEEEIEELIDHCEQYSNSQPKINKVIDNGNNLFSAAIAFTGSSLKATYKAGEKIGEYIRLPKLQIAADCMLTGYYLFNQAAKFGAVFFLYNLYSYLGTSNNNCNVGNDANNQREFMGILWETGKHIVAENLINCRNLLWVVGSGLLTAIGQNFLSQREVIPELIIRKRDIADSYGKAVAVCYDKNERRAENLIDEQSDKGLGKELYDRPFALLSKPDSPFYNQIGKMVGKQSAYRLLGRSIVDTIDRVNSVVDGVNATIYKFVYLLVHVTFSCFFTSKGSIRFLADDQEPDREVLSTIRANKVDLLAQEIVNTPSVGERSNSPQPNNHRHNNGDNNLWTKRLIHSSR
jgi:hypothetical protein